MDTRSSGKPATPAENSGVSRAITRDEAVKLAERWVLEAGYADLSATNHKLHERLPEGARRDLMERKARGIRFQDNHWQVLFMRPPRDGPPSNRFHVGPDGATDARFEPHGSVVGVNEDGSRIFKYSMDGDVKDFEPLARDGGT